MAWQLIRDYGGQRGGASKKKRTYREGYTVLGTGAGANALAIRQFIGIIPYVTVWPDDPAAVCISTSEEQEERNVWRSEIEYSTIQEDPKDNAEDPLRRPPKRSWGSVEFDLFPNKDKAGDPVVNSAGQRYENYSEPAGYGVLTIRRNEAVFDYRTARKYKNKMNKDTFYKAKQWEVLCKPITATEEYENGRHYAQVNYTFWFEDEGRDFFTELVDAGRYYVVREVDPDDGLEKDVIKVPSDSEETKFSDEVALNGKGGLLTQAEIKAGQFKYNLFQKHLVIPFGPLQLEW